MEAEPALESSPDLPATSSPMESDQPLAPFQLVGVDNNNLVAEVNAADSNPNRDSFLDWISSFLKPNQPSSPVLPIGDPPENCPPCGEFRNPSRRSRMKSTGSLKFIFLLYRVWSSEQKETHRRRRRSRGTSLSMASCDDVWWPILLRRCSYHRSLRAHRGPLSEGIQLQTHLGEVPRA